MHVAIAAHRLVVPNPTGVDRYVTGLARALVAQRDVDVTVGAAAEPGEPALVPDGARVAHVGGPRLLVTSSWCTVGRPRVDRAFGHPDLVHAAVPAYPFPARVPVVYAIHDLFPVRHPSWFSRKERFGFRRALDAALAGPAIVVGARSVEAELVARGADPSRVRTIPLGIDDAFFAADARAAAADGDYDLFVGAVNERKRLDVVVQALAIADDPIPLVVAGPPGPGVDAITSLAERLGVASLVRPVGFVPDAALPALMAGARALVQPSRDEGFGFTPLEAMAAGTPAVVARAGSLSEVVGDAAVVVDEPEDPHAWDASLASLRDPALHADVRERGRARAAGFTWAVTAARTFEVWQAVLDST
jgi:glycosyltransferase involved in cell wall biosynthesis